ncbi:dTDP-4-dehydrorhamnose 3,5-epimerase [bacterium]|nr:dTDP-4-dehydrorhamnose 3,5-epimerase [bacterium]
MPFEFRKMEIEDVILVTPKVFGDSRGFFLEGYKKSEFKKNGIDIEFNQDNHSKSTKGVLRGLHYQAAPHAQAKLVRCPRGKILDVAVDLRENSPTFKKWVSAVLSEENKQMLFIPAGFAHGFVVLSDEAELLYKASNEFDAASDRGVRWNDSEIGVEWGIDFEPLVSEKDANQPYLKDINLKEIL